MLKTRYLLIIFTTALVSSHAQEKFQFPSSNDFGMNITTVISSFIGNSNTVVDQASFPITAKFSRKKIAIRAGVGARYDSNNETLATVEQFIFNNYQVNGRVGLERKRYIGHKFGFFYGLDIIGLIQNEESTNSNNVDVTNLQKNTLGIGGGPIYGFEYYLNKWMYLGTEGNFYLLYKRSKETQEFTFNPAINKEINTQSVDASLSPPISLYIMVRF